MLDLHCSSVYSISLTAVDGNCSSLESQSVTLRTGEGCLGGGVNLNTQYYIYLDVKDIKKPDTDSFKCINFIFPLFLLFNSSLPTN